MMKKYKARQNWPITHEQAQTIGGFLEEKFPDGQVTPELFVEAARDKDSPVHDLFEWDDRVAADRWRKNQAQQYLRAIVVVSDGQEIPAYHRVFVESADGHRYIDLASAVADEDLWRQVVVGALKEARAWSLRYRGYNQLRKVVDAIELTEKEVLYGTVEKEVS